MTSTHHTNYSVVDEDAYSRKEDSANKDCSDSASLGNSSNEHAKCSNKEEKGITEALLCFIKDIQFDDQTADFGSKEREAVGNFSKNALLSLGGTLSPFPLDKGISSDNHEEKRIDAGLHAATCIAAENTWGIRKISDIPTLQSFHNQSIMKDANSDLSNHLLQESVTTSAPPSLKEITAPFQQFNANTLSAETKVTAIHSSFQKQNISKHANSHRTLPDVQGKQHGRKRGEFKRTNRGGNRYKGKKSDHMYSQQIVRNGVAAICCNLKSDGSNGESLKNPLVKHSEHILSDSHVNKIVSGGLCGSVTSGHLPKHIAKEGFPENKLLYHEMEKKTSHSPTERVESPKLLDEIKHSEGHSSILLRESDNGETFKACYLDRNCADARNAIIGKYFMQHPYKGGYYDMGHSEEQHPSGRSIVMQHTTKQQDKKCIELMGNTGSQYTNLSNLTDIQNSSPLLHTGSIKDELIFLNLPKTVPGPPWVSLCDLSMLLSTIINIYLQAYEMGSGATKDVCGTLNAVIGLVEETVKGMQMYDRMMQSAVIQTTSNLLSHSFKKLEEVRDIILLQRKNVKQAIDVTQTELKSTDPHASYSVEEISDICDRTKRKVVEQMEKVKWLNNDLKFDHCFLKLTVHPSCKERMELTDILFKDIEKAKQYLELPVENSDCRSDSSSESLGSGTYYMQLMKQCFIIKQSLEKLQYECA